MAFGLDPEQFWKQTPRSLVVIFRGAARAAKREHESRLSAAWHNELFARQSVRDFKVALKQILSDKPPKAQSNEEILAVMRQFAASGAPLTFKQIN